MTDKTITIDPDSISRDEFEELVSYVKFNHALILYLYKKLDVGLPSQSDEDFEYPDPSEIDVEFIDPDVS